MKAGYSCVVSGFICSQARAAQAIQQSSFFWTLLLGTTAALLTISLHCDGPQQCQEGNLRPCCPVLPSKGRWKSCMAGPEPLYCNHLLELYLLMYPCACSSRRMGLRRLWDPVLGLLLQMWLLKEKHLSLCGFVCSYPTIHHISQHCWRGLVQQLRLTSSASQGRNCQNKSFDSSFIVLQQEPFAGGTTTSKYLCFHGHFLAKRSELPSLPGVLLNSCHQSLGTGVGATGCTALHVCISNEV